MGCQGGECWLGLGRCSRVPLPIVPASCPPHLGLGPSALQPLVFGAKVKGGHYWKFGDGHGGWGLPAWKSCLCLPCRNKQRMHFALKSLLHEAQNNLKIFKVSWDCVWHCACLP